MTTITVEIDDDLHARARDLAAASKMTVAEMVEGVLRAMTEPVRREDLPPLARQAYGMFPPMTDEEVERVLDEERMRKYGSK